jgi:hypothetical protein
MAHLGFIIVPNGYTHEKVVRGHGTSVNTQKRPCKIT